MTLHEASPSDRVLANRYRLGARRGAGIELAVFDAIDLGVGRPVLVKIVHPDLCAAPGFGEQFREVLQRVASIDHPNVGRVLDWGRADWNGRPVEFVVTDVLNGGSVRDLLDRGRQLSPSQVVLIGLDVCRALDIAHRLGVVHGDVRPSNLVFGEDTKLRVVDLGLSRLVTEPLWADPSQIGLDRARYASPEQAAGQPGGAKSDVYSLCLTLIELLTGQLPFVGDSAVMTLQNRIDRLMPVSADFGPLAAVLERAGRPDPDDRSTAAEFGRGLVQAAEKLPRPQPLTIPGVGLFADAAGSPRATNPAMPAPAPTLPIAPTWSPDEGDAGGGAVDGGVQAPTAVDPALALDRPVVADGGGGSAAQGATGSDDEALGSLWAATSSPEPSPFGPPSGPAPVATAEPDPATPGETVDDAGEDPGAVTRPITPNADLAFAPGAAQVATAASPASTHPSATPVPGDEWVTSAATRKLPVTARDVPPPPQPDTSAPILRERRSRRKLLAVLLVGLLAAGLGGGVAWWLGRDEQHTVPELAGMEQGEALNRISEFGWTTALAEESSDTVASGVVIRTDPLPGTKLSEGATFTIVTSKGPAPRALPDLAGATLEQARATLTELQLVLQEGEPQFHETVPSGTVIAWSVPSQPGLVAGDTVLPGTPVLVIVSGGPAPRTVADFTGLGFEEARATLEAAGLVVERLPDEFSDTVAASLVARQEPAPGSTVPAGGTVRLAVSKGQDLVVVPPLAQLTVDQVEAALEVAGLVLGDVEGDPAGVAVLAEVDGVSIGADVSFPRGTAIDVTFEVPAPPTTTAPPTTVPPETTIDPAATTTTVPPG